MSDDAAATHLADSYRDSLGWLFRTQLFGIKLGLENIERLLAALGRPDKQPRIIHVAGTNGKGSVCAMLDAICRAQGYRTGLFTSPHLVSFRERIQVDGEMISEEAVIEGLALIRNLITDWDSHPTFFEIVTALALRYFGAHACDIVVLETGMGGRLDATNAVVPVVSVITPIALDHQKWLGNTLTEIAAEKAGIIKPSVPVVSAVQSPEAEAVIHARANACHAPLVVVRDRYQAAYAVSLAGSHQKENASLARAALRAAGIDVADAAIAQGLSTVRWPARFQRWDDRVIIDGAHNPGGADALAATWREQFGEERATILVAILRDKDAAGIVAALAPIAARFVVTPARAERALTPSELTQIIRAAAPGIPITTAASCVEAFAEARADASRMLVTGSLHFAGEALAVLSGKADLVENCLQ
ncbi:MAG: bifunctional folylpolyglutamate synthase/dihydrofolate synthase [Verrucomicrobiota bacterium]|nr:bifunctional folylpolyglutamate synthase/dihydrofolate synthase [Verrucomicrobiota bacterium]